MGENPEFKKLTPNRDIRRIIECPVCHEVPFPPIYLCTTGHSICHQCKPKLQKCPLCQKVISDTRNYLVEEMVLASTHSCAYKDDGCKTKGSGEVLRDHMKTCQYRPFMCPGDGKNKNCALSIKLSQAQEHFSTTHKAVKTYSRRILSVAFSSLVEDHSKLKKDTWWYPSLIEQDGKSFLGQLFTRNGIFYWTLFCFGTAEETGKYKAKITFWSKRNNGTRLQWNFPVQPIIKGEELREGNELKDVLIPSCSFEDFKKVAVRYDGASKYVFHTEYKISKRE